MPTTPDATDLEIVDRLVEHYRQHRGMFDRLGKSLFELTQDERLRPHIHSALWRAKDPEHLRDKLLRKLKKARDNGVKFDIDDASLFEKINDLAGVRILHLHTNQFPEIDLALREILSGEGYNIIEGPEARVWDHEYQAVFQEFGVKATPNPRMYTSVHYVVSAAGGRARTAEIQVRTLAEEIWGEVDHQINYPHPTESVPIREQIRVLARVASSCTRLVDSIFKCR
jgi:putative GTP pyrophosphokinase